MPGAKILDRWRRDEQGSALAEFALVLPALAFMLVAMVDLGRGLAIDMTLTSAARAGAEYGSLFPQDEPGLNTAVADALGPKLTAGSISASTQCRCSGAVVACAVACGTGGTEMYRRITVNYNYAPLLPYPGIAENYALSGSAEFRMR